MGGGRLRAVSAKTRTVGKTIRRAYTHVDRSLFSGASTTDKNRKQRVRRWPFVVTFFHVTVSLLQKRGAPESKLKGRTHGAPRRSTVGRKINNN